MTAKDILLGLPNKVDAELLENVETILHFEFSDEGPFTLNIKDKKIQIEDGLSGDPECVISCKGQSFVEIMTGETSPMMAFMSGKLKLTNPTAMLKYASVLGMM